MNDINYVLIEGKLTKDPELALMTGNLNVCKFTIAVNSYYLQKQTGKYVNKANFFVVETWGDLANTCGKNLEKGRGVRIVGKLKQSTWKDSRFGESPRERVYILAEHVEFALKKKDSTETTRVACEPSSPEEIEKAEKTIDQAIQQEEPMEPDLVEDDSDIEAEDITN